MSVDRWEKIKTLFHAALTKSGVERDELLDRECAGDEELRREIDDLLESRTLDRIGTGAGAQGLESAASGMSTIARPLVEGPGMRIGPYKLLQQIGEGGFGSVYMAEQQSPVVRMVALKIIKLGMDTQQVVARFEAERQMLAMMDHPNVAHVLDAGTTDTGRPYFVMELVRGVPITRFCDENKLSIRERLELLVQVCRAVQHAPTKGIIHRDIKPGNVMVTMHDDHAVPKVIDFGIAKAMHKRLTEKTLFTQFQQFVGTPAYMSPEQAQMSGLDVDTRSDIYSLGVLMYELLTGTTPFDSQKLLSACYDEMRRVIREDDPPRPSTRISSSLHATRSTGRALQEASSCTSANMIASSRRTEPSALVRTVRGELDWIVMKALEKNRTRRYESASALATDIEHYLHGDAVAAAPATLWYRTQKFTYRHRLAVTIAVVTGVSMLGGLAAATAGFVQAHAGRQTARLALAGEKEQRKVALFERDKARDFAEELRQQLYASNVETIQRIIATDGLDSVHELLDACEPDLRGWEWDRLNYLADRSDTTLPPMNTPVRSIEYSREGDVVLVSNAAGRIHILDGRSLSEQRVIVIHADEMDSRTATFSLDGRRMAAGDGNHFVHVWEVASGRLIRSIPTHADNNQGLALDVGGTRLALGAWFEKTCIFDVESGKCILELGGELSRARTLRFTRDGTRLMVGSLNNSISMVDAQTGAIIWSERGAAPVVWCAALSRDETLVASGGTDGRIWVRRAETGELLHSLPAGKGECNAVAFHPDGGVFAVGANDGLVSLFLTQTGEKLYSFRGHADAISALDFDSEGRFILSGDKSGVVKRWHLGLSGSQVGIGHHNHLTALAFEHDDSAIWFGGLGTSGGLQRLRFSDMQIEATGSPSPAISSLALSANRELIATSTWNSYESGNLFVLDTRQFPAEHWSVPKHFQSVAFSRNDAMLVGSALRGTIALYDAYDGRERWIIDEHIEPPGLNASVFSNDGKYVINSRPDSVRLLDADTGRIVNQFTVPHRSAACIALNEEGDRLFAGGADGVIRVWNWKSGELVQTMDSQPSGLNAIAFLPGQTRMVSGAADGSIRLWDTESGRQVMLIGRHNGWVNGVAVSNDGASIASCGRDNKLVLWETRPASAAGLDARLENDRAR